MSEAKTVKFPPGVWKAIQRNRGPEERALFYVRGAGKQALVAFETRVLIVKTGLVAGAMFGSKATSFNYRDITGIEVRKGMVSGYIEILTAGMPVGGSQKVNPDTAVNCLPFISSAFSAYEPYVERLRNEIARTKSGSNGHVAGVAEQLQSLSDMREKGILSDEEFEQAKRKVLS